jgi:2-oxoglutarate/2-oxoacid ferredoxin oxidoreductase subunit alpha
MVQRRLDRMEQVVRETERPVVVEGPEDAEVCLVSWGSTVEACREARIRLEQAGLKARVVAVRLLWPFPREAFARATGALPLFVVEANAFAQLARLIRSELPVHGRLRSVLQFDGRTMSSQRIVEAVEVRA